jgi:hypothetical protein
MGVRTHGWRLALVGSTAVAMAFGLAPGALAGTAPAGTGLARTGPQVSQPGWQIYSPPGPSGVDTTQLTGVSCAAADACLAVGQEQPVDGRYMSYAESWNGSAWTFVTVPHATNVNLNGVVCLSATDCLVVGDQGAKSGPNTSKALAEVWNGSAWTALSPIQPKGTNYGAFDGLSCTSATRCMAVGSSATQGRYSSLLAESWNGSKWELRTTPKPSGAMKSQFNGVSCASATSCVAVGGWGYENAASNMLAEVWNGKKWVLQTPPTPSGGSVPDLMAVSCAATAACTAVGTYASGGAGVPLAEGWNGTSWTQQSTPNPAGSAGTGLGGVSCPSAGFCVAVGGATFTGTETLATGEIWNGSTWTLDNPAEPSGATTTLLDAVSCPSATDCMAAGLWEDGETAGDMFPFAAQYSS